MAPFEFTGTVGMLVALAIGFCFGFVLERAGFGNAKNLAAQFYLYDMRVLKVMFTAIITAMVLVFLSTSLGLLDFSRVWVPPTYLGSAALGGFVLGIGFIVGGYCPGTSLVSMATFKIDGAFFVLGVVFGSLVFAGSATALWSFWNEAGFAGRLTLFGLAGVDAGVVVAGVLGMAIVAFACAEWAERRFARTAPLPAIAPRTRRLRRSAVAVGAALALGTLLIGQPTTSKRMDWKQGELDRRLAGRDMFIDAAELLGLVHNNQISLLMLDVRSESDFNVFHLLDARRVSLAELETDWAASLPAEKVLVVMSNDERAAVEAWRRLAVHANVNAYVLAGGINRWLDLYSDGQTDVPGPDVASTGTDRLRHEFSAALGDRTPSSRPDSKLIAERPFPAKVKVLGPVRAEGGGCG